MSVRGSGKHYEHKVNCFDGMTDCSVELGWFRFFTAQHDSSKSFARAKVPVGVHIYPKMCNVHAQSTWMRKFFMTMNSSVALVKQ